MNNNLFSHRRMLKTGATLVLVLLAGSFSYHLWARMGSVSGNAGVQSTASPVLQQIEPSELLPLLKLPAGKRPLLLQIGIRRLYDRAHIPGSEYLGPAYRDDGLQALKQRVASLPRSTAIIIYCGCCPWDHCPNIHPAFKQLTEMGFTNVKVLHIAQNFAQDWTDKGLPVDRSEQ